MTFVKVFWMLIHANSSEKPFKHVIPFILIHYRYYYFHFTEIEAQRLRTLPEVTEQQTLAQRLGFQSEVFLTESFLSLIIIPTACEKPNTTSICPPSWCSTDVSLPSPDYQRCPWFSSRARPPWGSDICLPQSISQGLSLDGKVFQSSERSFKSFQPTEDCHNGLHSSSLPVFTLSRLGPILCSWRIEGLCCVMSCSRDETVSVVKESKAPWLISAMD